MPASPDKRSKNELMFREVNEHVYGLPSDGATFEILCECGSTDCTATFEIDKAVYERVRSNAREFLVLLGHEMSERERVVDEADGHLVVQKIGPPGEFAERFDPRFPRRR